MNATTLPYSMMQAARVNSCRISPLLSSMTDSKLPGAPRLLDEYRSTSVDTRALVFTSSGRGLRRLAPDRQIRGPLRGGTA